jgi:hypothetical protein
VFFHRQKVLIAFAALAVNACSVRAMQAARVEPPRQCSGGTIEIVNDAKHYAGCSEIFGNLLIKDAAISDLSKLASLRVVHGALVIAGNDELKDLSGLENLESVSHLELSDNARLTNVSALAGLRHAPTVRIRNNPQLDSLHGVRRARGHRFSRTREERHRRNFGSRESATSWRAGSARQSATRQSARTERH